MVNRIRFSLPLSPPWLIGSVLVFVCIINNYLLNTLKGNQIIECCLEPSKSHGKPSKYSRMMPDLPECKLNDNTAELGAWTRCWDHLTQ